MATSPVRRRRDIAKKSRTRFGADRRGVYRKSTGAFLDSGSRLRHHAGRDDERTTHDERRRVPSDGLHGDSPPTGDGRRPTHAFVLATDLAGPLLPSSEGNIVFGIVACLVKGVAAAGLWNLRRWGPRGGDAGSPAPQVTVATPTTSVATPTTQPAPPPAAFPGPQPGNAPPVQPTHQM